jgi:hypothetical protein
VKIVLFVCRTSCAGHYRVLILQGDRNERGASAEERAGPDAERGDTLAGFEKIDGRLFLTCYLQSHPARGNVGQPIFGPRPALSAVRWKAFRGGVQENASIVLDKAPRLSGRRHIHSVRAFIDLLVLRAAQQGTNSLLQP